MSDFDAFVKGPIFEGDVAKAVRLWRGEYASARLFGGTALHWACQYTSGDREGVVRVLLDRGCDTEAETEDDDEDEDEMRGWRPLHVCAANDSRDAMRVLLKAGCCPTALTREGETPLEIAERGNNRECASMLRAAVQNISDLLKLLKNNSLSKIVEPKTGKTVLDKMLNSKDQRIFEALKAKQVDEQEIKDWKSLKLN